MINIEEYIKLPQEERQKHLVLGEPCIERGGQSMYLKGLLAHLMETTIPSGKKIHVCHACNNAACSNPNHIYWGTPSENAIDRERFHGGTGVWGKMVAKYGDEGARALQRRTPENASKAGKANKGKPKSEEHKKKIAEAIKAKYNARRTVQ